MPCDFCLFRVRRCGARRAKTVAGFPLIRPSKSWILTVLSRHQRRNVRVYFMNFHKKNTIGAINLSRKMSLNRWNNEAEILPKQDCDGFIGWLVDWAINSSIDCLIDCLIDWLTEWQVDWLIDWLIDWLVDWLIDEFGPCHFAIGLHQWPISPAGGTPVDLHRSRRTLSRRPDPSLLDWNRPPLRPGAPERRPPPSLSLRPLQPTPLATRSPDCSPSHDGVGSGAAHPLRNHSRSGRAARCSRPRGEVADSFPGISRWPRSSGHCGWVCALAGQVCVGDG